MLSGAPVADLCRLVLTPTRLLMLPLGQHVLQLLEGNATEHKHAIMNRLPRCSEAGRPQRARAAGAQHLLHGLEGSYQETT